MEEENKQEVKNETKKFDLKKFDLKKYLPIIAGGVGALVLLIILISVFGGGPKKAVKKYISGMNGKNAKKVAKSIDVIGMAAWGYSYNENDFSKDDYKEFIEDYEDYEDEMKEEIKDRMDDMIDSMDDSFDDIDDDYKSYKIKVEEFKDVEKLGKDLYAVKAKIAVKAKPEDKDDDEIDESEIMTFVVYKNKLVSLGGLDF